MDYTLLFVLGIKIHIIVLQLIVLNVDRIMGIFLAWTQQKFGFIFQDVPGKARLYDVKGLIQARE